MSSPDCLKDPPWLYRAMMHYLHVFTFPVYLAVLIVLYREPSKAFRTYKYYIMVHVSLNVVSEACTCYFTLPDTHLPHPMMRMVGWMAQWGFSGILIFYILAQFVFFTGGSVVGMFYYRYKACIFNYESHKLSKLLKFHVFFYHFGMLFHPVLVALTLTKSIEYEEKRKHELYHSSPNTIPIEVTCYSVMIPAPGSYVLYAILSMYIIEMFNVTALAIEVLLYITRYMTKTVAVSKATERLQIMLIFSLFFQAVVHGAMILAPLVVMLYAFFVELTYDDIARFFLIVFAYHGFCSTCVMILVTKPLRDKLLPFLKYIKKTKTEPVSTVAASTVIDVKG